MGAINWNSARTWLKIKEWCICNFMNGKVFISGNSLSDLPIDTFKFALDFEKVFLHVLIVSFRAKLIFSLHFSHKAKLPNKTSRSEKGGKWIFVTLSCEHLIILLFHYSLNICTKSTAVDVSLSLLITFIVYLSSSSTYSMQTHEAQFIPYVYLYN